MTSTAGRSRAPIRVLLGTWLGLLAAGVAGAAAPPACDADPAGLRLPEGFCALEVCRDLGAVRNLVVAPNGDVFAARCRGGLFVAFRGSWNRAPLPQEGYRVSFVRFAGGEPAGFETFAIGAADPTGFRMTGVAQGPDGSLYLAADANQRIWRVRFEGR